MTLGAQRLRTQIPGTRERIIKALVKAPLQLRRPLERSEECVL